MPNNSGVILLKHGRGWELPSVSPGCIQAEAYLRLAGVSFAEEILATAGTSPTVLFGGTNLDIYEESWRNVPSISSTCSRSAWYWATKYLSIEGRAGLLPAVDGSKGAGGFASQPCSDLEAAASVIAFVQKKYCDTDRLLSARDRAECTAFACLVENKLNAAVLYATWCEWQSMRHLREKYGNTLPWPLNYIVPFTRTLAMKKRFQHMSAEEVYEGGCAALTAIADRLDSSSGPFLLGEKPCSLDAKLYGLLAYSLSSPVVAPVLKDHIKGYPILAKYVKHVSSEYFSMPAPSMSEPDVAAAWSAAAQGGNSGKQYETVDEKTQKRRSWYWLGGVGALMVGYIVLGGHYFDIGMVESDPDDDED